MAILKESTAIVKEMPGAVRMKRRSSKQENNATLEDLLTP
jgi:hypothetical protein